MTIKSPKVRQFEGDAPFYTNAVVVGVSMHCGFA